MVFKRHMLAGVSVHNTTSTRRCCLV